MSGITNENLADLLAGFNTHDLDRIMKHFAPDAVMITPAGKDGNGSAIEGADKIRATFEARFAAQPDVRWNDAETFMSGDRAFTSWRVQSPASGIDIAGCDVWTFRDGKVAVKDTFYKQPA